MDKGEQVEGDWSLWFNSVICFGRMRLVEDFDETIQIARELGLKYYPSEQEVEDEIKKDGHRVLCMELNIEHMTGKHVHEK
jgi:nitroimidazol reductase NimA-like FMN-containing flavoprotein (pyridoxamine 5'-phosphate oxidase superfamily)